ncbi:MAG: hypothetical protein DWB43_08595 [Lautropia sp.]|nr:MAG: hypothetical protein EDM78_02465 [Pseudomonadota bacterium]MBC6959575.1 hypothetical protein [Lautropia sp.]MCL4701693.1 hypothetical protein [Burkholderiaceae bacterium]MDL1906606.1 hypothetical protein [Betaproteobacteria bacterium PRO1]RIK90945.1 MAG: hypothetical protein DCC70_02380 [Burkholderiales bacterium]
MSPRPQARVMPVILVRVSIDIAGIRAGFARERPPVADDDWDALAYFDERIAAYREALRSPRVAHCGLTLRAAFDAGAAEGDRVIVSALQPADTGVPAALVQAIADAVRPLAHETGAWRRHLRAEYFDRHRAWRRETGIPIAH